VADKVQKYSTVRNKKIQPIPLSRAYQSLTAKSLLYNIGAGFFHYSGTGFSMSQMGYTKLTAFLYVVLSTSVTADTLRLNNGDILSGTLLEQSANEIRWKSDSFGILVIDASRAADIERSEQQHSIAENPSSIRSTVDPAAYSGDLALAGSFAAGNQNRKDWDVEATVQRRAEQTRQIGRLEYESHRLDESAARDSFEIMYANDWFFNDQWFLHTEVSFGADETRAIDKTYSVGSAVGRDFLSQTSEKLSIESGLLWIAEEFVSVANDDQLTWSWSLIYSRTLFGRLELSHRQDFRVSLEDTADSQADIELAIRLPVVDNVFTEVKLEWLYDNQPVLSKDHLDSKFTVGIHYDW